MISRSSKAIPSLARTSLSAAIFLLCLAGLAAAGTIPIGISVTPGPLGSDWTQTESGGLIKTYELQETVPHRVSVWLSNGMVDVFRYQPDPETQILQPIDFLGAGSFVPAPGSPAVGQLAALGPAPFLYLEAVGQPGRIVDTSLDTWAPSRFRYSLGNDQFDLDARTMPPPGGTVPLPAPVSMGLLGLALMGLLRWRRTS